MKREPAPIFDRIEDLLASGIASRGRVVLANGCFDPVHVGHVRYLEGAAGHGDVLVLALNNDESTRRLKGDGRPVVRDLDRARVLSGMRVVDAVLLFGDENVEGILAALRPSVHAKGTDYTVETVPEREAAMRLGIETVIVGDPKSHASSDVVRRIREDGEGGDSP